MTLDLRYSMESVVRRGDALEKRAETRETVPFTDTAGTGFVWVRITGLHDDSPTGAAERIFTGDVYADGPHNAATAADVTIRIANIAAGVDTYPDAYCPATAASETWTNAAGSDVTETVYTLFMFVWWGA